MSHIAANAINWLEPVARVLIAALFLHQGYNAMMQRYDFHAERLHSRHIPFPRIVLALGFLMMFAGATSIILNIHAVIGATLLLIFTVTATLLYHKFWAIKDPERRAERRGRFMYNLAVIGGILLLIARA
jgi:putative oxidoreductase